MKRLRTFFENDRQLLTMTGIVVLHVTSMIMMRQLVPLYLENIGASAGVVGVITASFSFLPLVVALPGGLATDALGYRGVMVSGALCLGVATAILSTMPSLAVVTFSQLLAGLGHILVLVSCQAYVATMSSDAHRARNFAIFFSGPPIGFLVGPPLAGLLKDVVGFSPAFLASMAFSATVAMASLRVEELKRPESDIWRFGSRMREQLAETLVQSIQLMRHRVFQIALLVSMVVLMVLTLRTSFLPIFLEEIGHSAFHIGLIIAMISVMSLVLRPFMGRILDSIGPQALLFIAFSTGAVGLLTMALFETLAMSLLGAALFGVTPAFVMPVSMSLMSEHAPSDSQGMVMGLRQTINPLGLIAGPLVFGGVTTYGGTPMTLVVSGILFLVLGVVLVVARPLRSVDPGA